MNLRAVNKKFNAKAIQLTRLVVNKHNNIQRVHQRANKEFHFKLYKPGGI